MFSFHTYYITVWFLHGQRAYTYKTQDKNITVNTVVLVPTGPNGEIKPAIVSGVSSDPPADFPAEKIKPIVGRAGVKGQALFKDIDMRIPFDISSRAMKVNGEIVSVPTTHEERVELRRLYGKDPRFKIIEQSPEPLQGTKTQKQKQDRKAKKTDDLDWIDRIEEFNAFMEDD